MTERKIIWTGVARFAQAKKEARDLAGEFRKLQAAEKSANESSYQSGLKSKASLQDREKAADSLTGKLKNLNQTEVSGANQSSKAEDQVTKSVASRHKETTGLLGTLQKLHDAEQRLAGRVQSNIANAQKYANAQKEVGKAQAETEVSSRKMAAASAAVEQAENRLAAALQKHGAASKEARNADINLNNARSTLMKTNQEYERSVLNLHKTTVDSEASSKRYGTVLAGLGKDAHTASSGFHTLGRAMSMLKFPVIGSGAVAAGQAIMQLAGGATALVTALSPLTGIMATMPQMYMTLGASMGTAKLAFSGVGEAVKAYSKYWTLHKDALAGVEGASEKAKEAQKEYEAQLKKLPPVTRAFVKELVGMTDELEKMRRSAAQGLLPGLTDSLKEIQKMVPLVTREVKLYGQTMGELARKLAEFAASAKSQNFIEQMGVSNRKVMSDMGEALISVLRGMQPVMLAARTLTEYLSNMAKEGAAAFDKWANSAKGMASLETFFKNSKTATGQLVTIVKELAGVFAGIGRASRDAGQQIMNSLVASMKGLHEWVDKNQKSLKAYFDQSVKTWRETGRLVRDLALALLDLGKSRGTDELIRQLRKELLPALKDLLDAMGTKIWSSFVTIVSNLADALTNLLKAGGGGALNSFFKVLEGISEVLVKITENSVGRTAVTVLLGLAGAIKAFKFVAAISGLSTIVRLLTSLRRMKPLSSKQLLPPISPAALTQYTTAGKLAGTNIATGIKAQQRNITAAATTAVKPAQGILSKIFLNPFGRATSASMWTQQATGLAKYSGKLNILAGNAGTAAFALSFMGGKFGETMQKVSMWAFAIEMATMVLNPLISGIKNKVVPALRNFFGKSMDDTGEKSKGFASKVKSSFSGISGAVGKETTAASKSVSMFGRTVGTANFSDYAKKVTSTFTGATKTIDDETKKSSSHVANFAKSISSGVSQAFSGIGSTVSKAMTGIRDTISRSVTSLTNATTSAFSGVSGAVTRAWSGISGVVSKAWSGITSGISGMTAKVTSATTTAFSGVTGAVSKAWSGISGTISNAWSGITSTIANHAPNVSRAVSSAFSGITSTASKAWSGMSGTISKAWTGVTNTISNHAPVVTRAVGTAFSGVGGAMSKAWSTASSVTTKAFNGVTTAIGKFTTPITSAVTRAFSGVTGAVNRSMGLMKTGVINAFSVVNGNVTRGFSGIRSAASGLSNFLGGPWGVAMATAAGVIGLIANEQSRWKTLIDETKESLNKQTGAVTEYTTQLGLMRLAQPSSMGDILLRNKGEGSLLDYTKHLGISDKQLAEAIAGNKKAYDQIIAAAQKHFEENSTWMEQRNPFGWSPGKLKAALDEQRTVIGQSKDAWNIEKRVLEAVGEQADKTNNAHKKLNDTLANLADKARNAKEAITQQTEAEKRAEAAAKAHADAEKTLADRFAEAYKKLPTALQEEVRQGHAKTAKEVLNLAKAYDLLPKEVITLVAATNAVKSRKDIELLADAYKMTPKQVITLVKASDAKLVAKDVEALADKYKMTPKEVTTLIQAKNVKVTAQEITDLAAKYKMTPQQIITTCEIKGIKLSVDQIMQLHDKLKLTPKEVVTMLKAAGTEETKVLVERLQQKYNMTPKQIETLFNALTSPAVQRANDLIATYKITEEDREAIFRALTEGAIGKARALVAEYDMTEKDRKALFKAMTSGAYQDAADLINKYVDAEEDRKATFTADTSQATAALNNLRDLISSVVGGVVKNVAQNPWAAIGGNFVPKQKARGGAIFGPGTETSDSIPALLSTGEHVWTAAEVRAAGGHERVETLRMKARKGQLRGYAQGGAVEPLRFAAGGAVGLAGGGYVVHIGTSVDTKPLDNLRDKLQNMFTGKNRFEIKPTVNISSAIESINRLKSRWDEVWGQMRNAVGDKAGGIGNAIASAAKGWAERISGFGNQAQNVFRNAWQALVDVARNQAQNVANTIGNQVKSWGDRLRTFSNEAGNIFRNGWQQLADIARNQAQNVQSVIGNQVKSWGDRLRGFTNEASNIFRNGWQQLADIARNQAQNVQNVIGNQVKNWGDRLRAFNNEAGNVFRNAWQNLADIARNQAQNVQNVIANQVRNWGDKLRAFGNEASSVFRSGWQGLENIARNQGNNVKDVIQRIFVNDIPGVIRRGVSAIGSAWSGIRNQFSGPVEAVKGIINGLRGAINGILNALGWSGIAKGGVIEVQGRAKGGTWEEPERHAYGGIKSRGVRTVLPGFTPGRDVHKFYSPTGGLLMLSGGEAIMRPEFTRAVGGEAGIERLNKAARDGRLNYDDLPQTKNQRAQGRRSYADGGVLKFASGGWVPYDWPPLNFIKFVIGPFEQASQIISAGVAERLIAPIRNFATTLANNVGGGYFGRAIAHGTVDKVTRAATAAFARAVEWVKQQAMRVEAQLNKKADGGVIEFAGGGVVPSPQARYGIRRRNHEPDTVPARLTPGEFVVKREAVQTVGVPFLEDLNQSVPTGKWHRMRSQARYGMPPGVFRLLHPEASSGFAEGGLVGFHGGGVVWGQRHFKHPGWGRGHHYGWCKKHRKHDRCHERRWNRWWQHVLKHLRKHRHPADDDENPETPDGNEPPTPPTPPPPPPDPWKDYKYPGETRPLPGEGESLPQANTVDQLYQNMRTQTLWQQELNWYLTQLSKWGLKELVSHLLSLQVTEALPLAKDAIFGASSPDASRVRAQQMNDQIIEAAAAKPEDEAKLLELIGYLANIRQAPGPGLRETARAVEISDLALVKMVEQGMRAGWFARQVNPVNMARLLTDIASFREGTYYMARGGKVPGGPGQHGDSVAALLTPGEFVLRKSVVNALGLGNLMALNNMGFAEGGLVGNIADQFALSSATSVPSLNITSPRGSIHHNTVGGNMDVNYNYDITINNPISERSTKSLTKMMQRRAVMGDATSVQGNVNGG